MDFIKSNGLVSYERIGKFISTLPKDKWLNLKNVLMQNGFLSHLEPLLPAFIFFQSVGHVELRNDTRQEENLEIMVFAIRKKTKIEAFQYHQQPSGRAPIPEDLINSCKRFS